jgi:hypothetical protein
MSKEQDSIWSSEAISHEHVGGNRQAVSGCLRPIFKQFVSHQIFGRKA